MKYPQDNKTKGLGLSESFIDQQEQVLVQVLIVEGEHPFYLESPTHLGSHMYLGNGRRWAKKQWGAP